MIKVKTECPVCKATEEREFTVAQLCCMSWVKFPQPLEKLETGTVSATCGGYECKRELSMRVGIRFECWTPGR